MSQLDLLYRLQQLDDEIRESKKRLTKVILLQKETSLLKKARQRVEVAADELHKWRGQQTDLNLELTTLTDKVQREETRLYSGTVTNTKELADIQHELESLARRRNILEDELIEAMILAEEAQEEDEAARSELADVEAAWLQDQEDLKNEQAELVNRINELTVVRKQQLGQMSAGSISAYENAIRRAGLSAVVLLKNGRCRGCQVTVPVNLIKNADEGKLVTCDSCTRILCPA
jgi:predicted  nucleic acid-binding Zn-ribbon protein